MNDKLLPVEEHPMLRKSKTTGAVINVNSDEISAARERKRRLHEDKERIAGLENDVSEIKQLLLQLIGKENG